MRSTLLVGALATLLTGMAIGIQATLNSRIGSEIGPIRTGLWMNFVGGAIAGIIILFLMRSTGGNTNPLTGNLLGLLAIAGALGILVITGVSFSLARTGVAAGLGGMFLGQVLVGVVVDTFGWGVNDAIPLDPTRIFGLLLMTFSLYLLLPRG